MYVKKKSFNFLLHTSTSSYIVKKSASPAVVTGRKDYLIIMSSTLLSLVGLVVTL